VYKGSTLIRRTTTGRAKAGGVFTAANWRMLGVCVGFYSDANGNNETAGVGDTSGTVYAKWELPEQYLMTVRTAIRTNAALGTQVILSDDVSVGGTAIGTNTGLNQIIAGNLVAFDENSNTAKALGWVQIAQTAMGDKTRQWEQSQEQRRFSRPARRSRQSSRPA
jgi:hypothetical protein